MLETLRAASKSWVAAILIGMLILSFAIWGINDIFRGNKATWLAKVGDTEIDQRTFDTELRQRLRRMPGPDGRPMTVAEAQAQGIDRVVLESMIADIAVLQEARRMGLTASDQMVRDGIAAIPGLLGPDGNIDQQRLQQGLYDMGLSEAQFVELMREDLIRAQLLQTAQVGAPAPRTLRLRWRPMRTNAAWSNTSCCRSRRRARSPPPTTPRSKPSSPPIPRATPRRN